MVTFQGKIVQCLPGSFCTRLLCPPTQKYLHPLVKLLTSEAQCVCPDLWLATWHGRLRRGIPISQETLPTNLTGKAIDLKSIAPTPRLATGRWPLGTGGFGRSVPLHRSGWQLPCLAGWSIPLNSMCSHHSGYTTAKVFHWWCALYSLFTCKKKEIVLNVRIVMKSKRKKMIKLVSFKKFRVQTLKRIFPTLVPHRHCWVWS